METLNFRQADIRLVLRFRNGHTVGLLVISDTSSVVNLQRDPVSFARDVVQAAQERCQTQHMTFFRVS